MRCERSSEVRPRAAGGSGSDGTGTASGGTASGEA